MSSLSDQLRKLEKERKRLLKEKSDPANNELIYQLGIPTVAVVLLAVAAYVYAQSIPKPFYNG